jgi:hypothetical protein
VGRTGAKLRSAIGVECSPATNVDVAIIEAFSVTGTLSEQSCIEARTSSYLTKGNFGLVGGVPLTVVTIIRAVW